MAESDKALGLYTKYLVYRVTGEAPKLGEQWYPVTGTKIVEVTEAVFVLKPESDPHAQAAMLAYAESARQDGYVKLADEITSWMRMVKASALRDKSD